MTSIGNYAFASCTGLSSITIPDSVTSIGKAAFAYCTSLTSIIMMGDAPPPPNIGSGIFDNAGEADVSATAQVYIQRDATGYVTTFGNLNVVTAIEGTVQTVGPSSTTLTYHYWTNFQATITDCDTSATGSLEIPSTVDGAWPVTSIGKSAFANCTDLSSIIIGNSVTSIGNGAFASCTGLTSITIPDSVKSIGEAAFAFCTGLSSITIPDSVKSIGESAFALCINLNSFDVSGENQHYSVFEDVLFNNNQTKIIAYPAN